MSLASLVMANGDVHNVLGGALMLPRVGVGEARIECDADVKLTGSAKLVVTRDDGAPANEFVGTIGPSSVFAGRATLVLVLGNGMLASRTLAPRQYVAAPALVLVLQIVADIVVDAGEVPTLPLLLDALPRWVRARGTASDALRALQDDVPDLAWRVLPSGLVFVGRETWPEAPAIGIVVQGDDGVTQVINASPAAADIFPGQTLAGLEIENIVYHFDGGLSAEIYYR